MQARGDNGGKGTFNRQETDGWREKSDISESPVMVLVVNPERTTNIQGQQQPTALQSTEMPVSDGEMMDGSFASEVRVFIVTRYIHVMYLNVIFVLCPCWRGKREM